MENGSFHSHRSFFFKISHKNFLVGIISQLFTGHIINFICSSWRSPLNCDKMDYCPKKWLPFIIKPIFCWSTLKKQCLIGTETDIDTRLTKAWTAINRLSVIWKSYLTDKMKRSFFQAATMSILLYGCTTWTLTKQLEKKLDSIYTRILQAILKRSWRQHPSKQQLYGYLPPITKTIQIRRTRHVGHCWRSRDDLISDVLLWTPSHGRAKAGWPARTYIPQLCGDTGCSPEDLPEAMNDRKRWRERVRDIRADGMAWW